VKGGKVVVWPVFTIKKKLLVIFCVLIIGLFVVSSVLILDATRHRDAVQTTIGASRIAFLLHKTSAELAVERGLTFIALYSVGPAGGEIRAAINTRRASAESMLAEVLGTLKAFDDFYGKPQQVATVEAAFEEVKALRQVVDRQLGLARDRRDDAHAKAWLAAVTSTIWDIHSLHMLLMGNIELQPLTNQLMTIDHFAWVTGEFAGRQRAEVGAIIARSARLEPETLARILEINNTVESTWRVLKTLKNNFSAEMEKAIGNAEAKYFNTFTKTWNDVYEAGVANVGYPLTVEEWFEQASDAIDSLIRVQTAARDQVQAHLRGIDSWMRTRFMLALLVSFTVAVVGAISFWVVNFEVLRPVSTMTNAMHRLVNGEMGFDIPVSNRGDEIGMMARAIAALNEHAIERQRAEAALKKVNDELELRVEERSHEFRKSEARLRAVIECLPGTVVIQDLSGHNQIVNKTFGEWYAADRDEIIGKTMFDYLPPQIFDEISAQEREVVETKKTVEAERRVTFQDGVTRDVFSQKFPIFSADGECIAVGTIVNDITERKRREEQIRKLTLAVEQSPHMVVITDVDGTVEYVNSSFTEITGYTADEAVGQSPNLWKSGKTPKDVYESMWGAISTCGTWRGELLNKRKDGTFFWVSMVISPVTDSDGHITHFVAVEEDITTSKKTREELSKVARAVEQSVESVVITDKRGTVEYVNPSFTRISGYTFEEAVGQNPRLWQSGETTQKEYKKLWGTILTGNVWRGEFFNKRKNGELYQVSAIISPIKASDGTITHFVGVEDDITERIKTQRALQQAQKMEAVGQLTGGIAHDFNNILAVVLGNLQLLQRRTKDDSKLQKLAATGVEASLRGADLTRQLLAFSRRQELNPEVLDANELVANMDNMLRRTLSETVEIKTVLGDGLGRIKADPAQLESAILNLSINARDAMPQGGVLVIETSNADLDEAYVEDHPYAKTGPYIYISVTDTGTGIPADMLDSIFEPFFTTKEVGKGTGLGLSMVYGFVKQSNGHVTVYSEKNQGTCFRIYLPRTVDEVTVSNVDKNEADEYPTGTETIFVVEDEDKVRETAAMLLEDLGYTVVSESNGLRALKALETFDQVDLLFTDMIMPGGVNGLELAEQVAALQPGIKVLLTSGYPRDAFQEGRKYPLLAKPYTNDDLARTIRNALDNDQQQSKEM